MTSQPQGEKPERYGIWKCPLCFWQGLELKESEVVAYHDRFHSKQGTDCICLDFDLVVEMDQPATPGADEQPCEHDERDHGICLHCGAQTDMNADDYVPSNDLPQQCSVLAHDERRQPDQLPGEVCSMHSGTPSPDSPTPITDDAFDAYDREACGTSYIRHKMQQLERENAALVKEREALKQEVKTTVELLEKTIPERNQLRATLAERDRELEHWKTFWASKSDAIRREVEYLPPASMVRQFVINILENNAA